MEEKKWYIREEKTGELTEVSELEYNWKKMINMIKPKFHKPDLGRTAGDLEVGEDLNKIFYKPQNYNVM